jgi:hypothetical protein
MDEKIKSMILFINNEGYNMEYSISSFEDNISDVIQYFILHDKNASLLLVHINRCVEIIKCDLNNKEYKLLKIYSNCLKHDKCSAPIKNYIQYNDYISLAEYCINNKYYALLKFISDYHDISQYFTTNPKTISTNKLHKYIRPT